MFPGQIEWPMAHFRMKRVFFNIRDRVFEPFVTAGKANGLGLGLALSRRAVLDHGGDV